MQSLEQKLSQFGSPVEMLRTSNAGSWGFPLPMQYSSFLEEQKAWANCVALCDMGQHMPSLVYTGPDVKRLFSDLCVNGFATFSKNNAKQFVMCRDDGYMIGDGVVVALEDDQYEVMGIPVTTHWLEYNMKTKGYDVTVAEDPPTAMNTTGRRFYRYQVQGPDALKLLEGATGKPVPPIKFFHVGDLEIAGHAVRAISHTMARATGFELFGPRAEGPAVLEALRAAGRPLGMREAGATSLPTTFEGGWVGLQVPAIYSGENMKAFREFVPAFSFEGFASLGGSFNSPNIEDYYVTPWDIGYDHVIRYDHEFVGRAALEVMAKGTPRRKRVFLRWNEEDCARAVASALVGSGPRTKLLGVPISVYATFPNDQVMDGETQVGTSIICGYSANVGSWLSLATIETAYAVDGTEVEVLWGDADTSKRQIPVEPNVLTRIRATVSLAPPLLKLAGAAH